ncbi:VOC family protein [Streptomyces sp. WAC05374]|uniref:VOC family protein n=1 Tax=Streptomyces sp. WAC05374 TaxID=2487420 RepID=UPI000F891C95|nr:VOC family protein [Streptomyces sp. WAC05374]RST09682.1 VOC family protein [Streptomyces sp. WAC05374]TDF45238.1 VOC family protein [Streptomyces sp. WAC05374]TDF55774.1 VOC family protein [Streptomyces sp. WAC05374]TDF58912.1 VOC family protein [Streptomyces sp. WAC05374]
MSSRLNPYISFDGNAREAMEFYQGVFGGTLRVNTYADFGMAEAGESDAEKIMHSMLETERGLTLMGADTPPGSGYSPGNNISVSVSGEDAAELRGYWDKLSAGATVTVPLDKQMWGDVFGMCTDRFGITWMININQQG